MKFIKIFFITYLFLQADTIFSKFDYATEGKAFAESFADGYDFRTEGRYTREYHKYLLEQTKESLNSLESKLTNSGFNLVSHQVIVGYERGAIPSYYLDFSESEIDDEATSRMRSGWSLRLHNKFGLMSGFLFKDINKCSSRVESENYKFTEHINPNSIEVFNDEGGIFLEHSFGNALPLMFSYQEIIENDCRKLLMKKMFSHLIDFWTILYNNDVKSNDQGSAATQDILFSVEYAKYLQNSSLPISKLYVGGDITYPIETFVGQEKNATKNAQDFVKIFAPRLKPIKDENTVYVFCSFVDGVGKSTMLGNIKNWIKHKDDVESYERVDNSSSQYAEVFKFEDKVFIADLPAQISHFTYKPDGLVYVPAQTELSEEKIDQVREFVLKNVEQFKENYKQLYEEVGSIIESDGYFASIFDDKKNPEYLFLKNIILLKKEAINTWVPFEFESTKFLFNYADIADIRILRSLGGSPSSGLKNIESEQMLFYEGLRYPLTYQFFLDDLVNQLKVNNVKNVVFINFNSMYPRSSRENIRVNYLLQQIALVNQDFNVENSLYKNFINPAQLYADLLRKSNQKKILNSFISEIALRTALYKILKERESKDLTGIKLSKMNDIIENEIKVIESEGLQKIIEDLGAEKFKKEFFNLKNTFGLTKELINIQLFSFDKLIIFSSVLNKIFTKAVINDHLNSLWSSLDKKVAIQNEEFVGTADRVINLEDGNEVFERFEFYKECKDQNYLTQFFRTLRSAWYAACANLIFTSQNSSGYFEMLKDEKYKVIPFAVSTSEAGHVYCFQKLLDEAEMSDQNPVEKTFNINSAQNRHFGTFNNQLYCLDWNNKGTNSGLFSFDCNIQNSSESMKRSLAYSSISIITHCVSKYQLEHGIDTIMPLSKLYKILESSKEYLEMKNKFYNKAKRNGIHPYFDDKQIELTIEKKLPSEESVYLGRTEQRQGAALCARLLATLEMILKDPMSDVCVRPGNKKDFIAALKMFEEVVFPKFFGIYFEEPLFDNYEDVTPIIPFESFED